MHLNLAPALWAPSLLASTTMAAKPPKNAILLSQVQTLTLRGAGAQTTHRRVPAMPQLQCVSNPKNLCRLHEIDVMRCTNEGPGYETEDIQWSCTASLPPELKLGGTEVMCEGYSSPDDPYVLKGSCGVQYRLILTAEGERRYPEFAGGRGGGGGGGSSTPELFGINAGTFIFCMIFIGVVGSMIYNAWLNATGNNNNGTVQRRPRGSGGGGGGGGWGPGGGGGGGPRFDDNDDPPPPYSSKRSSSSQQQQQGWRPGFWTGAASGAAAGYFAGNRGNSSRQQAPPQRNYGSGYGGSSGWGAGPSYSSSSSASSDRHESTGFGGTSRR
ncbi:hypothetical protein PG993_006446 [Apiospora rasikravindrae]|uniref:Store-operated calcium entry-associated regulatory factor n=1 Tax=Apiospora rasikravindrae TaxID=990691 RepID=A0ABR1T5R1_9PEZI